jgi:hypothetical protein
MHGVCNRYVTGRPLGTTSGTRAYALAPLPMLKVRQDYLWWALRGYRLTDIFPDGKIPRARLTVLAFDCVKTQTWLWLFEPHAIEAVQLLQLPAMKKPDLSIWTFRGGPNET